MFALVLILLFQLCIAVAISIPQQITLADSSHPEFTVIEQDDGLCDAGTRQWTGTVHVGKGKKIFFWFFESRSTPETDPVILWLNGGPGGSSELGLFEELGPCFVTESGNATYRNTKSWVNAANLLFVDQPAGVGYSTAQKASDEPSNLHDVAVDFHKFLSIFFTSVFPSYAKHPFHIAGESFGGHYVPAAVKYILERNTQSPATVFPVSIESLILVDAAIDNVTPILGQYDHFCSEASLDNGFGTGFNQTACDAMRDDLPQCEQWGRACNKAYDVATCKEAEANCTATVGRWFDSDVVPGGRNPYDDRQKCIEPPLCSDIDGGPTLKYLNQDFVLAKLGYPSDFNFSLINFDLNGRWDTDPAGDTVVPTSRELAFILDESDIRVLFLNGNNDVIINTPGQIRMLDDLSWHDAEAYKKSTFEDWFWTDPEGKRIKGGQRRGIPQLMLYSVDEAGHTSPGDAPEGIASVVRQWTKSTGHTLD